MVSHYRSIVVLLWALYATGCATIDYGAEFVVQGCVQDSHSRTLIPEATIRVLDNNLDYVRSKSGEYRISEGRSGADGTFSVRFSYWWGTKGVLLYDGPPGSIKVILSAQGYTEKEILLRCSPKNYSEGCFKFDLGSIALDPI
jgi:hypothetical protein